MSDDPNLESLSRAAEMLNSFSSRAVAEFGEFVVKFSAIFYRGVCLEYLKHHKRLPGSIRTARGRKKRATRVFKWYEGQVQADQSQAPSR